VGRPGELRIGTSGFDYAHWRGVLYPPGLPRRLWLERYAQVFDTVEIDSTFYRLPAAAVFDRWRERAPAGFRYALKLSRYATHMRKLQRPRATLRRFLVRAERLGPRLGPILVQLPPRWRADPARLDAFLRAAPRRRRWAVELRDPGWLRDDVLGVLRRHGAALCIHDALEHHPRALTARWTYLRFHGAPGGYSPQRLGSIARWIRARLAQGVDVWACFNNDAGGAAVRDALALRRYVLRPGRARRDGPRRSHGAGRCPESTLVW
jgi:uncharacterized protein YecE (DUF72 family)